MIPLTLKEFGGQFPAWDDRYLPDNQASFAKNTFLYSGALIGWRKPKKLRDLDTSTSKFAYRIPTTAHSFAGATLAFLENATQGDQITIGEATYTFTATVTNAYDVLLGATALASAQNLFLSLQFGDQDTAITGNATVPNGDISANSLYAGYPFSATAATIVVPANTLVLVKVIPTGTQKLISVDFMPASTSGTAKFKGVIYNNVNSITTGGSTYVDQPSNLIASGMEITGCNAGVTLFSFLTTPVTLTGGSTYWVGFVSDTDTTFAQASDSTNAVSIPNTYTDGPLNPVTGTGVVPLAIATGQPNYQIWGDMVTISGTDSLNNIGTNDFGTGSIPYISVQAPDIGAAYNNTSLGENTSSSRMTWVRNLSGLDIVPTLSGGLNATFDASITSDSTWLEFDDPFTDVVKSPVVDDHFKRFYFASPTQPPQYNTYDRIIAGADPWLLGVPAPGNAPTISPINGGDKATNLGFDVSSSTATANFVAGTLYLTKVATTAACAVSSINVNLASLTGGGTVYTGGGGQIIDVTPTFNNFATASDFSGGGQMGSSPAKKSFRRSDPQMSQMVDIIKVPVTPYSNYPLSPTDTPLIGAAILTGVIYLDSNGTPGALYAAASAGLADGTTSPGEVDSTFVTPAPLLAHTNYWIGIFFNSSGTVQLADDFGTAGALATVTGTVPIDLPTNAPDMTLGQQDWNVWAVVDNSAAIIESRAYVYTWVTEYGEEGPPSPPTLADGWNNGLWQIGIFPPLQDDMGGARNIVKANLYRTITGTGGGTTFFQVAEMSLNQTTYEDASTDDLIAENSILPSTNWFPPPEGLEGIADMPNGVLVGFKGNELWFCEPYRPHAWPPGYVLTVEFPIVGIGIIGQAVVACTSSSPAMAIGTSPAVMSLVKMNFPEPCNSRGSIISTADAVLYTSNNGLISVTQGGTASNLSQSWITREKWVKYVPQSSLTAIPLMGSYFAFGTTDNGDNINAQRGITIELNANTDSQGFGQWPQIGGHRLGLQQLTAPGNIDIDNVMLDPWSSAAMLIQDGSVYYYDFEDQAPEIQTARWISKKYQTAHKDSFAAMRVWFDIPPGGPQSPPSPQTFANPTFTTSVGLPYTDGMFGVVRVLADGKYVMERELRYSTEMMRIPDGFKASTWQWEYEGVVSVTVMKAATSAKELGLGAVEGRP